jgi:hypothetical protein
MDAGTRQTLVGVVAAVGFLAAVGAVRLISDSPRQLVTARAPSPARTAVASASSPDDSKPRFGRRTSYNYGEWAIEPPPDGTQPRHTAADVLAIAKKAIEPSIQDTATSTEIGYAQVTSSQEPDIQQRALWVVIMHGESAPSIGSGAATASDGVAFVDDATLRVVGGFTAGSGLAGT